MWCFDRRVLLALGAAAVGVLVFDPSVFGRALPVLVALACPGSMLVMMRGLRTRTAPPAGSGGVDTDAERAEIASLRAEVAAMRARLSPPFESPRKSASKTVTASRQP